MNTSQRSNSLKKNVSWMFIGNGSYAFALWVQLSLVTKYCGPMDLGTYTLALAVTAPVFMFTGLNLRAIQVTDVKGEWRFADYFTLRLFSVILGLLIIGGYALLSDTHAIAIFLCIGCLKAIEGFAEVFNSKQQLHEQMKNIAISLMLKGLSATISIAVGVYFFHALHIGLLLAIFTNFCVLFFNDYRRCLPLISGQPLFEIDMPSLKALLIRALPLGIVMFVISVNTNVSKYFAEYFLGTAEQGVYSTISYLIVLGNFVNMAIGQSFTPRLSRYYADGQLSQFIRLKNKFMLISTVLGAGLFLGSLVLGKPLLTMLFSKRIAEYHQLFTLVMFAGIFVYNASALGFTLTSMRIFKVQPYINLAVLAVNCISSYFLIKSYGLYGITYASVLGFATQLIVTWFIIRKHLKEKSNTAAAAITHTTTALAGEVL
ncbi:oligosaccharide flippase family protein [Chitinophaga sp. Mgbs1]|uniref:Oligosaccharide flippase family protein n=1 Tax=Chitinophaga solisilvae TaxID=1233460 RepID=A0A3S1AX11_9BACT|nr:oligosaccharide flippase family protein [Chitinophaga solisilvae]